jgi:hypothetical protein
MLPVIHVSPDRRNWSDPAQRIKNRREPDVAGMNDVFHTAQGIQRLRPDQPVSIRYHTDPQHKAKSSTP